ncbi:MAG: S8 family peptidase [Candidatus Pacebacteria bacterium]|nr:S8 family peptidase [Candidatus Paceibacterota bacterium]
MPNENNERRPMLHKGQVYSKSVTKKSGGGEKTYSRSFDEALSHITTSLESTLDTVASLPQEHRLPNEFVFCIRMDPDFTAKSYYPESFLRAFDKAGAITEVGSRKWTEDLETDEDQALKTTREGKLLFIRSNQETLTGFVNSLKNGGVTFNETLQNEMRTVEEINLLTPQERLQGFDNEWVEGQVEVVIHPFETDGDVLTKHFIDKLKSAGVNQTRVRLKHYPEGLTFASFKASRANLEALSQYNPLRSMHPLEFNGLPEMRASYGTQMPNVTPLSEKSSITVGVFDGGIDDTNNYLNNQTEGVDLTAKAPVANGLMHGTAVTGLILYGEMNQYPAGHQLPTPPVSVRSFRVFPLDDDTDIENQVELYEIIDKIEDTVPKQTDIKVYNISFGPSGPILDDSINRFTWALDRLAHKYGILFCVAVGNDGERVLNRVQAPSDMVNGLGVGAYNKVNGVIGRAAYSCVGPGREGNKIKPDLCAFGGCAQNPIQLVPMGGNNRLADMGTSYSSPLVARAAAEILGRSSDEVDHLAVRAMLIHSAQKLNDDESTDIEHGHGIMPDTVEEIMSCKPGSYTLLYRGAIAPAKYAELQIPWDPAVTSGTAKMKWTLVTESEIDPNSPDDYTTSSVEMTLYPNAHKYRFVRLNEAGKKETRDIDTRDAAQLLEVAGWEQSTVPITATGTPTWTTEEESRRDLLKWDTVEKRVKGFRVSSIASPCFHIHGFNRGIRAGAKSIDYALVLTIEITSTDIDLYSSVVHNFGALQPIRLVNQNELVININS